MERVTSAMRRSAELSGIDLFESEAVSREATKEKTTRIGTFHSAVQAIAIFADGRLEAARSAHEFVAAIDERIERYRS